MRNGPACETGLRVEAWKEHASSPMMNREYSWSRWKGSNFNNVLAYTTCNTTITNSASKRATQLRYALVWLNKLCVKTDLCGVRMTIRNTGRLYLKGTVQMDCSRWKIKNYKPTAHGSGRPFTFIWPYLRLHSFWTLALYKSLTNLLF